MSALAVVDREGIFMGMIPPHRLLAVLLAEHDEDMARFGGLLRGTAEARSASEAPVPRRSWHRVPWLFVGLAGALLSVDIVRSFERDIANEVSLAFFLPAVVYSAGARGAAERTYAAFQSFLPAQSVLERGGEEAYAAQMDSLVKFRTASSRRRRETTLGTFVGRSTPTHSLDGPARASVRLVAN